MPAWKHLRPFLQFTRLSKLSRLFTSIRKRDHLKNSPVSSIIFSFRDVGCVIRRRRISSEPYRLRLKGFVDSPRHVHYVSRSLVSLLFIVRAVPAFGRLLFETGRARRERRCTRDAAVMTLRVFRCAGRRFRSTRLNRTTFRIGRAR